MLIKKIAAILIAASFAACGASKNDSGKATAQQPAPVVASTEAASIPNFFVIKVPVDANGNETADGVETKTFVDNEFSAAESTGLAFEKGSAVSLVDELDQDSSTAQWYYRGHRGGHYGRGYYGRSYTPYYSYYGSSYNYGYYNSYRYNSCNYYVYSSPYYY